MYREEKKNLRNDLQNYEYYKRLQKHSLQQLHIWEARKQKTKNRKYAHDCEHWIYVFKMQDKVCRMNIRYLDRILQNIPVEDRNLISSIYVKHIEISKVAAYYNFKSEGDLWVYVDEILEDLCMRVEEYYEE